ncbi:hypothetical protein BDD12DRAFT_808381 [Trichophaea hybrida]|nr:hypothetical protein BDD12DRAFT_808381 [Trichophaea hybrida]
MVLDELAGNEARLIVMAVPLKANTILFTSTGFGGAYCNLIVQSGHGQDDFIPTCEGGAQLQEAAKATTSTNNGTTGRNLMHSKIVQMLKDFTSKIIYFLLKGNVDESSQYWIVLLGTNLNIKIHILKLEIDSYLKYKIRKYLLVSNFTTTTTPSNIINTLQWLFGSPAATMLYESQTGCKAKSKIAETAACGGFGGPKRATMNAHQADNILKRRAPNIRPKPHWLQSVPVINHNRVDGNLQLPECFDQNSDHISEAPVVNILFKKIRFHVEFKYDYFLYIIGQCRFFPAAPRKLRTAFSIRLLQVLKDQSVRGSIFKSAWADGLIAVCQSDHMTSLPNFARSVVAQRRDYYHHLVAVQYAISTAVYHDIDMFQRKGEKCWQLERLANLCPDCANMDSGEDHTAFITSNGNMQPTRFKDHWLFEFEVFSQKLIVDYDPRQIDLVVNKRRPYNSRFPDTEYAHRCQATNGWNRAEAKIAAKLNLDESGSVVVTRSHVKNLQFLNINGGRARYNPAIRIIEAIPENVPEIQSINICHNGACVFESQ